MPRKKIIHLIIMSVVMLSVWITASLLFNYKVFHEEPVIQPERTEAKVCVTTYGECYHHYSCSYINNYREIGLDTAIERGYRECSYCHGETFGTITYPETVVVEEQNEYFWCFFLCLAVCLIPTAKWYDWIDNRFSEEKEKNI